MDNLGGLYNKVKFEGFHILDNSINTYNIPDKKLI